MKALLDTTILIAATIDTHPEHEAAFSLIQSAAPDELAIPAHACCEAYARLTSRAGPAPLAVGPGDALAALDSIVGATTLVGLTPAQTVETLRDYARSAGIGARLYDRLIGEAALLYAIPAIITLNVRHFSSLFPNLRVCTPAEYRP